MKPRISFPRRPPRDPEREAREREAYDKTHRVLLALPEQQWSVISPYELRHGRPAHVMVGPGGVYLIIARKPPGSVRVKDGTAWLRHTGDTQRERPGTDVTRKAVEPAQALAREIRSRTGRGPVVHPVVVLWSEFPQGVVETSNVTYVHGRELAGWLRSRAPELEGQGLDVVAQATANIAAEHARGDRMRRIRQSRSRAA
jgi:hypothetical protein